MHQASQHTCNNGSANSVNNRCNGAENMTFAENYFPPPILPPPQQPTVYSHPEARRPPSVSPPCPEIIQVIQCIQDFYYTYNFNVTMNL